MEALSRIVPPIDESHGALRIPRRWPVVLALLCGAIFFSGQDSLLAGTLVKMEYANFGTVQIDLFDDLTPVTVTNFLHYVTNKSYSNTIIHRVDSGLGVIQGGGFNTSANPITTFDNIVLEYARANTRGTISMARQAELNTASSQWFINTDDNTTDLGQSNGGGYAVFGQVVGPGMSVVDGIAAVPTFKFASPFAQVPLQNYTQADLDNSVDALPHTVVLTSVTVVGSHPSYQNPYLHADVDNNGTLQTLDLARVVNDLIAHGIHDLTGPYSGTDYLDVSGDGKISPIDVGNLINALILQDAQSASFAAAPMAMSLAVVPEPASLVTAGSAMLLLAGYGLRRRMRRGVPART